MTKTTTESESKYQNLDKMSVEEILSNINKEDRIVPYAIEKVIPEIAQFIPIIVKKMQEGGRLFYLGAGTSGRLGIVDASECPPTFGVSQDLVIGLIAGGNSAIRKAVEFAEDDEKQAWKDLQAFQISQLDVVVGIAASGRTPYVVGAMHDARNNGLLTACIVCNPGSKLAAAVDIAIEAITGPEFITGSTRMKAGTAQKLILNILTTSLMVRLGKVKGNKMTNMQLTNNKLVERGVRMLMEELHVDAQTAANLLQQFGSVQKAIDGYTLH